MTNAAARALSDRDLAEVWSKGDASLFEALYAPELLDHNPTPGQPEGRGGLKEFHTALHAAFADVVFTTEVFVSEGDLVTRRWTMRATHEGPFLGIAPTGRRVTMTGIDILRVVDGRFTEIWHNEDVAGLLDQLAAPPPSPRGRS